MSITLRALLDFIILKKSMLVPSTTQRMTMTIAQMTMTIAQMTMRIAQMTVTIAQLTTGSNTKARTSENPVK